MPNNISYRKIARQFVEKYKDKIPINHNYIDGKQLIPLIYQYIMETDCKTSNPIKKFFVKNHISKEFMYKTIRKMFIEVKKNFVIGNKVFLPSFGYYGVYISRNKKVFLHYHIYITHTTITGRRNRYKAVIMPDYHVYYTMVKNLVRKTIYR